MSDLKDVQDAFVSIVAQALYPDGTSNPSSANAIPCKVYAGWPTQSQLDSDLALTTPVAHVTVYPRDDERNTTRYMREWKQLSFNAPTVTLVQSGQTITVGGVIPVPFQAQNASIKANGKYFVYPVQSTDTTTTIATALAGLLNVEFPGTTNSHAVITVPSGVRIEALRVGGNGVNSRELRRQERVMQITVWAATPADRSSVASALDVYLTERNFITMPDSYAARMIYKSSIETDMLQKAKLYRRDILYTVEFATTQTDTAYQVTQGSASIDMQPQGAGATVGEIDINF